MAVEGVERASTATATTLHEPKFERATSRKFFQWRERTEDDGTVSFETACAFESAPIVLAHVQSLIERAKEDSDVVRRQIRVECRHTSTTDDDDTDHRSSSTTLYVRTTLEIAHLKFAVPSTHARAQSLCDVLRTCFATIESADEDLFDDGEALENLQPVLWACF